MYTFKKISPDSICWDKIENSYDSTIYKTHQWFDYLMLWQNIKPFIVEISTTKVIGYFVGEVIHKGITIIGSPFEGTGTAHQGLSMLADVSSDERIDIYNELSAWIFKSKYALFTQIEDWQLTMSDVQSRKLEYESHDGYMIDLSLDEDLLFHNLHQKSCRYSINKSKKEGISIRETTDVGRFVDVYYDQLVEVFHKQGLKPTYGKDCVASLVKALYPERLILLEAVTSNGEIAATGLFPGDQNLAIFWGGASWQRFQKMCPNEPLIWTAILMWKSRGTKVFDLCGVRPYKLKFGPQLYTKPRIIYARYKFLIRAKKIAKKTYYGAREFLSKFRK